MSGAGYVAVAVGGCALGWLSAWLVLRPRRADAARQVPAPDSLEREVLRRSSTGYLVLSPQGRPLLSNPRARELGVLVGGIVDRGVLDAAERAAVSGEPVDVELEPVQPPSLTTATTPSTAPTAIRAVVQSIDDERILVAVTDESAAQRVEAVRRDFVANVSHELKTPVAAIGLLAEATLDSADDPESVRHFAGRLHSESTRLGALVTELITLSRLQGADPQADAAVVEVDAVVDEAIRRQAAAAEAAGITVVADEDSMLLVRGDRALLTMALTNLVSNAINYSPAGTQVSVSRTTSEGHVRIAVTDRGVGIAPEYTERVFERFFRVDPARSRSTGGTGLGLAIVKQVAANHGGTATVWSRPGLGSTFTLSVPNYPGADGLGAAAPSSGTPSSVHRGAA
ncbi:sensor histidine kinase [Nakamurella sp.]|uniref:sensor histidine kinase n=1 Tax=Nakamurella sp. TaxID=1869182 RepID=UPI00378310AD